MLCSKVLEHLNKQNWISLKYRRVLHYGTPLLPRFWQRSMMKGYAFDYSRNNVDKNAFIGPLPEFCRILEHPSSPYLIRYNFWT
jgi:hypothetical protein